MLLQLLLFLIERTKSKLSPFSTPFEIADFILARGRVKAYDRNIARRISRKKFSNFIISFPFKEIVIQCILRIYEDSKFLFTFEKHNYAIISSKYK